MKAKKLLIYMIQILMEYLNELSDINGKRNKEFCYGEKIAYIECLEMVQLWEEAGIHGLDFDIEEKYPIGSEKIL